MKYRLLAIGILLVNLFVYRVPAAIAHGGEPRLEISVERINPGGVVDVRGVDFEYDDVVTLTLLGSEVEIPLGEITADTDGIFLQVVTLPADLTEGAYYFRAVTDDHEIISPVLTVQGPAILSEGGEGQREEEESLLAPMPTFAPGVIPGVAPGATQTVAEAMGQSGTNLSVLVVALLVIASIAIFLIVRRRHNL